MAKDIAVLAYSGGLDSTISIDWIKENYGYDVITLTVDLGGGQFSNDLESRAKEAGALECVILDVKNEFVKDFILPSLKAGVIYEKNYLLATSIGRPLMAKKIGRNCLQIQSKGSCSRMYRKRKRSSQIRYSNKNPFSK